MNDAAECGHGGLLELRLERAMRPPLLLNFHDQVDLDGDVERKGCRAQSGA